MYKYIPIFFCFMFLTAYADETDTPRQGGMFQRELQKAKPDFKDFPADPVSHEEKKSWAKTIDLASNPLGREYRTVLRNGFKEAPLFAGHYRIISCGCGSNCHMNWIVDMKTGKIVHYFENSWDLDFRADSNLLMINPMLIDDPEYEEAVWLCDVAFKVLDVDKSGRVVLNDAKGPNEIAVLSSKEKHCAHRMAIQAPRP